MPWEPPDDARTAERLSDWWLGTCRKFARHERFFVALGWGERLSRLFAVACCRAAFGKRMKAQSRELVGVAERFADGLATEQELIAAADSLFDEATPIADQPAAVVVSMTPHYAAGWMAAQKRHRELFGKILRAMVGPEMRWSDGWRTDTLVALARGIYDEQSWDRMPILSDALQEAGCDDHRVIGYCRGEGPFCRGCWLLDTILQKR
ncbi:MAG TPA: hypothetical protein VKE74_32565 [Gemmataceae bacterium]|nr:hypothetical protein [Gemmataceae bacterium]